jgi:hypothetical protein
MTTETTGPAVLRVNVSDEATTSGAAAANYELTNVPVGVYSHRLTAASRYAAVTAQLHQLLSLRSGWNGHGAASVAPKSVLSAVAFLEKLHDTYQGLVAPPVVGPLPDSGVILVWRTPKKEVEISFVDQGESIETAVTDRTNERPEEFHERVGMDSLLSVFVPDHLIGG